MTWRSVAEIIMVTGSYAATISLIPDPQQSITRGIGSERDSNSVKRFYRCEIWVSWYETKRDATGNTTNRHRLPTDYTAATERINERVGTQIMMATAQVLFPVR